MNKTMIIKAAHTIKDGISTKTIWLTVGRVTIFEDPQGPSYGVMRLNHIPNVTYQLFGETDK